MHLFQSIVLIAGASLFSTTEAEEVLLAPLSLRLASNSITNGEAAVVTEIRDLTTKHLNTFFSQNFESTLGDKKYFRDVELIEKSVEDDGSVARVAFEGSATFLALPLPQDSYLLSVYMNAFLGEANSRFVESLQSSDSGFLRDLTYLEISIDERPVSVQKVTPPVTDAQAENHGNVKVLGADVPLLYLIIGAVLIVVATVMLVGVCCYLRRNYKSGIPNDTDKPRERQSKKLDQPDLEITSTRSPSPIRSLGSQESSKFTYNPKSKLSDLETLSLSNAETRGIDVEAWQRGSMVSPITPAFGQDISAIEALDETPDKTKNDLSLIDEGSQEEITPASQYLSRDKLTKIHRRSPITNPRSNRYSKSPNQSSMMSESGWSDPNGNSFMSEGSDVISDLKNLSVQISKYRSHRR